MGRRGRVASGLMVFFAVAGLMSCAVVDQYSGRAVVYNLEAERAQEQALLLNIVRAYLRRPMQFTTVSSITGSATATGGAGYTSPLNVPFRPITNGTSIAAFPPLPAWSLTGSMSGGPVFTVPVLDTQEFYRGLLTPIPAQLWDLYIQNTYPRDLLFNLIVEKIIIRRLDRSQCGSNNHDRRCELVIQNYVGENAEIDLFQIFSDYLLALGLTTEPGKKPDQALKHAINVNLNVRGVSTGSSEASSSAPSGSGGSSSGGDSSTKPYSLCFAPSHPRDAACVLAKSLCVKAANDSMGAPSATSPANRGDRNCGSLATNLKGNQEMIYRDGAGDESEAPQSTKVVGLIMSSGTVAAMQSALRYIEHDEDNPDLAAIRQDLNSFKEQPVIVSVYTRSVEAILYYLGEVARRELRPDFHPEPRTIYYTNPSRYADYPEQKCIHPDPVDMPKRHGRPLCSAIFVLETGLPATSDTVVSTVYDGVIYSVPDGPSGAVLEIAKQALATLSSSKSLPQSNVISVVGQ